MLSILIPVFEVDVRALVQALQAQAEALEYPVEICCFDDGSAESIRTLNRSIASLPGVLYREMPENMGRSKIRNALAAAAKHPYLMFIDGDAAVPDELFLRRYAEAARPELVLVGGTAYHPTPPHDKRLMLRWHYGRHREQRSAAERNRDPLLGFSTFNFMVPARVFARTPFSEALHGYGHEDTLFGWELRQRGIAIAHIDNPLYHLGLDSAEVFLEKTRQGLKNLQKLETLAPGINTRLLQAVRLLRRLGLTLPVRLLLRRCRPWMERQLQGSRPSLRVLDLYKLGFALGSE